MTLLSAFKALLYQYSGQEDICIGTPIAGRQQHETEELIGFFVNTLAIRSHVDGNAPFTGLLQQVRSSMLEAYEHQEVPFEKIVDEVVKERDMSRNPLFQVMFVLRNTPDIPELKLGEVTLSIKSYGHTTALFDLQFFITETSTGLECVIEYNTSLYKAETIDRMQHHFVALLNTIIKTPQQKIGSLSILSQAEENQILIEFNNTQVDYPAEKNLVDLFEEQVERTPEATAVVFESSSLTYKQLNEKSNQLAWYLQRKGIVSETLVPICLERSLDMIVSILAVLKAGGAYVPIDPEYPLERINYMLNDTGASLVITGTVSINKLPVNNGLELVEIENIWPELLDQPKVNVKALIKPSHLAYVIYTSGSTGKPKGVMNEHRGIVNRLLWAQDYFTLSAADAVLQKTTFSFDVSVWELLWPLLTGARLVFAKPEGHKDTQYLKKIIQHHSITMVHFVPSMLEVFLADVNEGWSTTLKKVLCSGEALKPPQVVAFQTKLPNVELHNLYGPTEAAIDVSCWSVKEVITPSQVIPIGKPVANTMLYVLNNQNELLPVGVTGEIHIGGVQVARGYLNKEALTQEKFITNPFGKDGTRLYKTGDLGKWLPDGNIEYIGRKDDQVKIRGFRVELGEVEKALNEIEYVDNSCVIHKHNSSIGNRLVSYFIPSVSTLKEKESLLSQKLVASWQKLYELEYASTDAVENIDHEFNIVGWNDSFTGLPIPATQMRDWLNDIVGVILAGQPTNVLEIGSGTGLIYYQLAGKINKYIGTDFSATSINQIKNRISLGLKNYGNTELKVAAAHEVTLNEHEEVDTIIINSVVQYFPGEDYINGVIGNCVSLLKDNGRIIIGDVRDNRLLELFRGRLQLEKLQHSVSIKEFNWEVQQDVLKEEELCFSPAYFYNLQSLYPQISHVDIQWKHAEYSNELSRYRYTVIIHVGSNNTTMEPEWQSWAEVAGRQNIFSQINNGDDIIALRDFSNPRLKKEIELSKALEDKMVTNIGDIIAYVDGSADENEENAQLFAMAKAKGYQYKMYVDEDPLKVNLLFELHPSGNFVNQPFNKHKVLENAQLTNTPLFNEISLQLQKEIKLLLQQRLPDYMIPAEMHALQHLPLTANGKVDRKFLSLREAKGTANHLNFQPAVTDIEKILVSIWQQLLGLDRIGVTDNFFELGGHSLLAIRLISAIRDEWNVELLAKDIFMYPNIYELGKYIKIQSNVYTLEDDATEFETITL